MATPIAGHWYDAMTAEMQQLKDFDTWSLCQLPPGRDAIDCKWVLHVKPCHSGDGSIRKFKARLVVKGSHKEQE